MKLKPSEIAFVAVCLIAAAVSIAAVYISRERAVGGEIVIDQADSSGDEEYDVSVINSASLEDFMNISGIGEVKAGDIISFREALGGFTRVSQIKAISGISDSLYQKIIEYFYLSPKSGESETAASPPNEQEEKTADYTLPPEPEETSPPKTSATEKPTETEKTEKTEKSAKTEPSTEPERTMKSVDINAASAEEIAEALMIEPELAEEIVSLRELIHGFSAVQELDLCDGMTDTIYSRIKDYVLIG